MTLRVGLIGCGYMAKKHLRALSGCQEAELAAVSDVEKDRMAEAAEYYASLRGESSAIAHYPQYTSLLADTKIEAVIIAAVSGLHAEMAKQSLLAEKHVILEKPMTLSLEEADELIQLAEQKNLKLMVCHQMRHRPIMKKIKETIAEGKLGKPYLGAVSLRLNRSPAYYAAASWRGSWEKDGGMLINQGIHLIDLLQWFLGDVTSVYGEILTAAPGKETEDVAAGILTFANGAKGIIEANIVTQPNNLGSSLSIFGENGTISLEGPSFNRISRWYIAGEEGDIEEASQLIALSGEQSAMYQNFIRAVQDGEPLLIDGKEGKKALEAIFGIYQSALIKQPVRLPLSSFQTSDMKKK
ncbi:Gfo/Idh/MocA family protein [Bacillus sonorensis]|uniref:Gfo/Idh/MocA family protein n=1 Tax=Bacillus sonorensis TaxID=119858 RepID=UPI0018CEF3D4|nr:Gfo/Idh/MocA family oxidoreductase [Bacillus sonorensis]MBG9916341.1 oxidoreductase [Bacillus sonorensis]MCF7617013.1 Gfo/Idh/MocA family oxidoreductase [Bacillus sonorensis]MCY7859494.1 Gfo/Idh/MocA family oxidoreductase [Bacillus sonorensis]MCY8027731.1 Gfo/Idh/MocA family oxidoreductase [Bacillus sonorensis]MCY8272168.1 Gfo/Idh/MocA family oxidoreductase [Bacillus sonorensis]